MTPRDGPLILGQCLNCESRVSQGPNGLFHLLDQVTLNLWALAQLRAVAGLSNWRHSISGLFLPSFILFDPHPKESSGMSRVHDALVRGHECSLHRYGASDTVDEHNAGQELGPSVPTLISVIFSFSPTAKRRTNEALVLRDDPWRQSLQCTYI